MSDSNRADRGTADEKRSEFERLRPYLLRVAYSHLGTLSEAEDVVQSVQTQNTRGYAGERRETSRGARPMNVPMLAAALIGPIAQRRNC